jgi:hypothetical protein
MVMSGIHASAQGNFDACRFLFSQSKMVSLDEILHGIAKGRLALKANELALEDPHLDETPAQRGGSTHAGNDGPLTGLKLM